MDIDQEIEKRQSEIIELYNTKKKAKIDKVLNCKHKLSDLLLEKMYKSSPDGYGGDNEWEWYDLKCRGCGKEIEIKDSNNRSSWIITNKEYNSLCGRELEPKELKKLFEKNRAVYNRLKIDPMNHNLLLRELGYRTDELLKKIKRKRISIKKQEIELEAMLSRYNGEN